MTSSSRTDFEQAMALLQAVRHEVLCDWNAWVQEAARPNPRFLAWPWPTAGQGYKQLVSLVFNSLVEEAVETITEAEPNDAPIARDPQDPDFQVILRVAHRTVAAWELRLASEFKGHVGPLFGKREFINKCRDWLVDEAIRKNATRGEAIDALERQGISRAAAYRSMSRKGPREPVG